MQLTFDERYAQTLLASGERIIRNQRQHWLGLVARWGLGVILILVGIGVIIASGWFSGDGFFGLLHTILLIGGLVVLVSGIGHLTLGYFRWENDRDVVTTRRIIQTQGFINRSAADTSLEKINDAKLEQGAIARVFGYGTLDVMTASASGINKMRFLVTPVEFKKDIMDAKHELEMGVASGRFVDAPLRAEPVVTQSTFGSRAPTEEAGVAYGTPAGGPAVAAVATAPAAPAAPADSAADVTETLAKLADLRDKGVITAEDYEAKKTELLGRI
jgi:membrane protein YdbS with pleckstrin-like domain